MNKKKYQKLLWGTGFVIIVLILTLFVMSQTYIQNLVYHERLSQMEEVTHQMFRNLEDVIDNHWDEAVASQVRLLTALTKSKRPFMTKKSLM